MPLGDAQFEADVMKRSFRAPLEVRFWRKVDTSSGADACWAWTGALTRQGGYGALSRGAQGAGMVGAHRLAFEIANGPIPDGLWVLHSCDNPPCCNPRHLFLGTHAVNMRDASSKGRLRGHANGRMFEAGERHPRATLTERAVIAIRNEYAGGARQSALAKKHGVSKTVIQCVVSRKTWTHIS